MVPPTIYYSKVGWEVARLVFQGQRMTPPYAYSPFPSLLVTVLNEQQFGSHRPSVPTTSRGKHAAAMGDLLLEGSLQSDELSRSNAKSQQTADGCRRRDLGRASWILHRGRDDRKVQVGRI